MTDQRLGDALSPATMKLLTVNEVADVLGCGRTRVYELIDKGHLTRIKVGRLRASRRQRLMASSAVAWDYSVQAERIA